MPSRALLLCPGRGSYSREELGSLTPTPSVVAADNFRRSLGRPTPTELDAAPSYVSRSHVAGENASILTMAATLNDVDQLTKVEVVAVIGNSMGWYTALTAAGALSLPDGLTLVETMGQYQANNVIGGQILYPLVDDDWRPLPSEVLTQALGDIPGLYWSIHLGGQAVIGGTNEALATALKVLPPRKVGEREAPFHLPLHSAFHTPLMAETSRRALGDLSGLSWRAPRIPLVDGAGRAWRPRHADPFALRDYTLGTQVIAPYDFSLGLRVALREYAPDVIVLPGPGGNLGSAVAQVLIADGWRGIRNRGDFLAMQKENPVVLSMARPEQRGRVVGDLPSTTAGG